MSDSPTWTDEEIQARVGQILRLFSAWPSIGKQLSRRTVLTYVDATRGLPLGQLQQLVGFVIGIGGDFPPSAGDVVKRWAREVAKRRRKRNLHLTEQEVEEREFQKALQHFRESWQSRPSLLEPGRVTLEQLPAEVVSLASRIGRKL